MSPWSVVQSPWPRTPAVSYRQPRNGSQSDRLRQAIGVPQRLRELGATEAQLPEFADKAFSMERLMKLNPRRPTRDELLAILQEAL